MSELVTIRQSDLDRILTTLRALTLEVEELKLGLHDWEVVEPPCFPEGTSARSLADLHCCVGVEDGPPELPGFIKGLARSRLTGDQDTRAKRAFVAGFWAKAAIDTCTPYIHPEPLRLQTSHWILLRAVGLTGPKRFTRKCDFNQFQVDSHSVWAEFASLTEVHIFCAGACIEVPELVRWKSGR